MKNTTFIFQVGLFLIFFRTEGQNLSANASPRIETSSPHHAENAAVKDKGCIFPVASFPHNQTGYIIYKVPADFGEATVIISNCKGTVLKEYKILESGEGFIVIFGNTFPSGLYYYALRINGEILETKKLLLSNRM